ncbi:MAG: hypothetical protein UU24_C0037G0011 [Candidatus Nomurabacteria bacterium GW2011_GWA2_40_9]|uniref:Toxin YoeB n=1 Tax=Candidatus Nomurabacteria bacterium GW2011_GWA2_40_9 TaxID=1618734 RepID=A0A0G0TN23_9BACT|nr:MAG: hypothetical protein UU24_C0037G0011 [Candidatus Nomurabacteria bacterium GW2011_GWA2_40_9]
MDWRDPPSSLNKMKILPIHKDIEIYLKKHFLEKKFSKQISILSINISYPSLEVELLKPKHLKIWSFRVDKKYRAIFIFQDSQTIEILDVNNHYK